MSHGEDVIEVKPEILALFESFDAPVKSSSKGSSRALCMLKKNAKKRKRPDADVTSSGIGKRPREGPGTSTKRTKFSK